MNINNYGGKGVLPVFCGSYVSGTAFFVTPTHLLTAGHVIAEYILDKEAMVAVVVEEECKVCRVLVHQANPDVAILECVDYICPNEYVLPLLASKFKESIDLLIVGYPRELGNGVDYFGVTVKNSRKKADLKGGFDRMVVRTDSFGFNSYEGFSGSPVINDFGKVVGIETDQLYYSLGYLSIAAIKELVEKETEIKIEENDDLYDNTPYGLRRSYNHIREHTADMLKTRYNDKVHIENEEVEKTIQRFCGYGFEEERVEIHDEYKAWHDKMAGVRLSYIDSITQLVNYLQDGIITDAVMVEMEGLFYLRDSEKKLHADHSKELRAIYKKIYTWLRNKRLYEERQFMHVSGTAGCGKSHLLYGESLEISNRQRIYMLLGSEFSSLEDPENTIARVMGWKSSDPLKELNDELAHEEGKTATIIIDALNEGAGTHFWMEQLPILKNKISRYSHLKMIVSLRTLSKEDQLNDILRDDWHSLRVEGFKNRKKAIGNYFEAYEIMTNEAPYTKIAEFTNPLFLRMFCETYYSQTQEEREKVLRLPIYKRYLEKRNYEISDGVDEDVKRDITSKYILWVAQRSLEQFQCDDLPRQLAYKRSYKLCPFRTWKNSLLRNCLEANLLREYTTEKDDFVDFEFDSMGDYLKAERLLSRNCDDGDRFKTLVRIYDKMDADYSSNQNWQKKLNFVKAFLSVWNPPAAIWQKPEFMKGKLTSLLLSSMPLRNQRDEENTLTSDIIGSILQNNPDYIQPELILQNIELYSTGLMDKVHAKLMDMTMSVRDLAWTTNVNGLFDGAYYQDLLEPLQLTLQHEIETLLTVEIWMLSTSFPYLRAYMMRKVKELLSEHADKTNEMIVKFHAVNDPYILSGLYTAVYGVIVSVDKADFSRGVAEQILSYHYGEAGKAPQDLMVRHWTLKILELANHQDPTIDAWNKAQPPYNVTEDIFAEMPEDDYEADGYFGETYGGKQITRSLFHWDFSRYIIGTNSNNVSRIFFRDGKGVSLRKIEYAIAYLIKHKFGWNDELGKYDSDVPYQTRAENSVERIGKKYQWIGMYRVYAYLCDTCQIKINLLSSRERFAEKNYPWYAREHDYYDPTLTDKDLTLKESYQLFDVLRPAPTITQIAKEWLQDERQMPPLYFSLKDYDGREWIVLQAYSTIKEEKGDDKREQFVLYNGAFANKNNFEKLRTWASNANFYGRWMPENSGSIDYRWNEYPWADSYLQLGDEDDEIFDEGGGEMKLAYEAQLQEDYKGIDDECQFMSTAYMPCKEMMEMFGWHTAERGIIRDTHGKIVAINRNIPGDPLRALLVLRSKLDEYMEDKGLVLFWSLVGEKQSGNHPHALIARLTGAAAYRTGEEIDEMQPLRNEPPAPPRERVKLEKKDFPSISDE
ncbi:serine protease [Prevotella buccae]|uniref:serine protease n=1 Tax=Segatella buccae TaxID=28126 RepID=UPI001C5E8A3A|nr:serine protease [Segatella buccae]MBW4871996.1 serine protease [Segatella buccae]